MRARFVIVAGLLALASPSLADDAGWAKQLFTDGTRHYNIGEYGQALDEFKQAYLAKPDPVFLFNSAQCYRQLGKYAEAAKFYRSYRREDPAMAAKQNVDNLIADMERAVETAKAAPMGITAPGQTAPASDVPQPRDPPAPRPWFRQPLGWTLLGAGMLSIAVGSVLAAHSADLDNQIASASSLQARRALEESVSTYRVSGFTVLGVGAAAAIAGSVVFTVSATTHQRHAARPISVTVVPLSGGAFFTLGGIL